MRKLLAFALVLAAWPAAAMDFPATRLSEYPLYREQLIGAGWEPVEANPHVALDYKPFGLPEVDCGSGLAGCWAVWMSPEKSREIVFMVLDEADPYPRLILRRDQDRRLVFRSETE